MIKLFDYLLIEKRHLHSNNLRPTATEKNYHIPKKVQVHWVEFNICKAF